MVINRTQKKEISYRPAEPSDADIAGRLLFESFPKLATFLIGLGNPDRAKEILKHLYSVTGNRFSHEYTRMAVRGGRVVGLVIGYPGRRLTRLDLQLGRLMLRQYRLRGKVALFIRAWPLVFVKEAERDEFLLSNLAVKRNLRGQGIGSGLLSQVEECARQAGFEKVALIVRIDNQGAKRLYERHGFKVTATYLESNKRVPYVGPGIHRMVKQIQK
jgi:ribosomal protein S18 acetylase RimI-like enzyme